jgi:hypothetical protein
VVGVLNRLLTLLVVVVVTFTPAPARADTLCEDGWLSPSDGGSGTCSWHGGIADNGGGVMGRVLILGGGVALVAMLANRGKKK